MSSYDWWRSWHGAPMDPKWAVIAKRAGVLVGVVSAVAWALMDYASQHKERGSVEGFDMETYAVYSGFSETDIAAVLQVMTDKGIITEGRLTAWEKRQPKREDDSAERVRQFRERQALRINTNTEHLRVEKSRGIRTVTQCNTDVTQDSSSNTTLTEDAFAQSIYNGIAGGFGIPASEQERILDAINTLRMQYTASETLVEYLKPFHDEFKARYPSSIRAFWLYDWAIQGRIPQFKSNGKPPSPPQPSEADIEEMRRILAEQKAHHD